MNVLDVVLIILIVDCQLVLFVDKIVGVIGVVYVGWKGMLVGVLELIFDKMEILGVICENIVVVIGLMISQWVYEVGQELFEMFFDDDFQNVCFFVNGCMVDKF